MISNKNEMMNLINLVSPEVIDPEEHRGESMLDIYKDCIDSFYSLAEAIPADVYCLDNVRQHMESRNEYEYAAEAGYTPEEAEELYMEHFFGEGKSYGSRDEYKNFCLHFILEGLVYICPDCEDPFWHDVTLNEIAKDVLFVANNTEHDNPYWTALEAGVPVEDIFA